METKKDDISEINIKIDKDMNCIFVRDIKGLLSGDSFNGLKLDDDIIIKCKGSNVEYETVEIEKRVKVAQVDIQKKIPHSVIKEALLKCSGVKTALVSHIEGNAVIEANVDMVDGNEIIAAIEKAGFSFVEEE